MEELPLFGANGIIPEEWQDRTLTVRRTNPMDPPLQMHFGSRALLSEGCIYVEMMTREKRKDVKLDTLLVANNVVIPITLPGNDFANKHEWEAAAAQAMDRANVATVLSQFFSADDQKTVVTRV